MTLRVVHIIPSLDQGGAEKQLCLLAGRLPRDEFDVHVVVLTRDGPYHRALDEHTVPVHLIGKQSKIDFAAYRRLRTTIRQLQPDLVHTWLFAANSYGRRAAFAERVPHVIAAERCADHWKTRWHYWLDRRLARQTDCIVTNSSAVRQFYALHGIASDKFVVIPNGIDWAELAEPANEEERRLARSKLRGDLGLPQDAILIGAVGRLWPQKKYDDLLLALQHLLKRGSSAYLIVAGEGPDGAFLKQRTLDLNLNDHVFWLGHRDDVRRLLSGLDVFWMGSGYEGQSNSLMEAMAAALPVVVSDIPGNRDLVIPEQSGVLVAVGDEETRANRTLELLENPVRARQLGNAARERMGKEFSVEKMVEGYAELYRHVTREPSLVKLPSRRRTVDG